jgi:hypothetical protein
VDRLTRRARLTQWREAEASAEEYYTEAKRLAHQLALVQQQSSNSNAANSSSNTANSGNGSSSTCHACNRCVPNSSPASRRPGSLKPPTGLCSDVHTFAFERDVVHASDAPVQQHCEHCHTAAAAAATTDAAAIVNGATSPLYAQSAAQQQQQQQLQQYEQQLQQLQQQYSGAYTPATAAANTSSTSKAVRCASAPMHRPLPPPGYAYTPDTGYTGYTTGYVNTPVKHVNTAYLHAPTLQSPYCTPGTATAYSATTSATAGVNGGSSSGVAKEAWSDGYGPLQQQQLQQQQLQQQQVHYYQGQAHSPVRQLRYATIATHLTANLHIAHVYYRSKCIDCCCSIQQEVLIIYMRIVMCHCDATYGYSSIQFACDYASSSTTNYCMCALVEKP